MDGGVSIPLYGMILNTGDGYQIFYYMHFKGVEGF